MTEDLSYDEWIRYCFDRPITDPQWYWEVGDLHEPDPNIMAEHLRHLFSESKSLMDHYSEEQVSQGLYFIVSHGSEYLYTGRDKSVPAEKRVAWIKALCSLYRDLFSVHCSHYYGHLDAGPEPERPLNGLCYMFWDLDCLEGAAMFPGEEELVDPIFDVLECGLAQSNEACMESALHGLGHLQPYHESRVERIVNGLLGSNRNLTNELRDYAKQAKSGSVL